MLKVLLRRSILMALSMEDTARTTLNCVKWLLLGPTTLAKQPQSGKAGTGLLIGPEWTDNWGRPFKRYIRAPLYPVEGQMEKDSKILTGKQRRKLELQNLPTFTVEEFRKLIK